MRLLLDEMYPATVAEQLRARRHDVVSIHEADYRHLEGASDAEVFMAAIAAKRAIVTENVPDFRQLETETLARGELSPILIFTTNRRFPRGMPATVGRLVLALDAVLAARSDASSSFFLEAVDP